MQLDCLEQVDWCFVTASYQLLAALVSSGGGRIPHVASVLEAAERFFQRDADWLVSRFRSGFPRVPLPSGMPKFEGIRE